MWLRILIVTLLVSPAFSFAQTDDPEGEVVAETATESAVETEEGGEGVAEADEVLFEDPAVTLGLTWDEEVDFDNGVLYYTGSTDDGTAELVASAHDQDGDETYELWLEYEVGVVIREAHDTDGDGGIDLIIAVDANGAVTSIEDDQTQILNVEPASLFVPVVPQASDGISKDELIGDLSDISIEEEDQSWMLFVILLIVAGALYFFWQRQQ